MKEIRIKPIGFVRNNVKEPRHGGWRDVVSEITIDEKYSEALDGIDEYSHVIVVFWMHETGTCKIKHRPQGKEDVPVVGILACRCPSRPNPIGITTVKLLEHKGNSLKVKGLDVIDGTPVMDIKPYTPQYDSVKDAKVPDWVDKLSF